MNDQEPGRQPALEAVGLGRRYRKRWALRACDFRIPQGRVCGLVGPNGAGKSTLLAVAANLLEPTEGRVRLSGLPPADPGQRARVGYLAQHKPLYQRFTVAETLRFGRELNPGWDADLAERIVDQGMLPRDARIGSLSGGQRSRVALALVLGKRPDLLLLDEPMADLDPLARHQLMGTLMAEAAERGITIVLSSHILSELDGVIDHVLLLDAGRIRLSGAVEEILGAHRVLVGAGPATDLAEQHTVVESRQTGRQNTVLLRSSGPVSGEWRQSEPGLEELLLGYLRSPDAPPLLLDSAGNHTGSPAVVAA